MSIQHSMHTKAVLVILVLCAKQSTTSPIPQLAIDPTVGVVLTEFSESIPASTEAIPQLAIDPTAQMQLPPTTAKTGGADADTGKAQDAGYVNWDPIADQDSNYRFYSTLMNVSSDSNCKVPEDGEFTNGFGGKKAPLREYHCAATAAPKGAIVKVSRTSVRVTCNGTLKWCYKIREEDCKTEGGFVNGKEIPMKGEFMFLRCKDQGKELWMDTFTQVEEKEALKTIEKKNAAALNIAVVVMDSMSRAATMNYIPKTVALLKKLQNGGGNHRTFVYNRAAILGPGTANNLSPLLCGRAYKGTFADMVANGWTYSECQQFIWNWLKSIGYVSLYGVVANMFAGQKNWNTASLDNVGHLTPQYMDFDDASVFIECSGCDSGVVPCCAGKTPAAYQFHHATDFHSDEVYPKAGKFSLLHLMNAHSNEAHMQSEDESIRAYISKLLEREDTVVHLMSDHGNGNEGWRLPMSALVVPLRHLEKYPSVAKKLELNQQRLMTHFDMYETYKHLASYPEHPPAQEWENKPASATSILTNELSKTRSCAELDIPPQYCPCLAFEHWSEEKLRQVNISGLGICKNVFKQTITAHLEQQNQKRYKAEESGVESTCMILEFGEFVNIQVAATTLNRQGDATANAGKNVYTVSVHYKIKGSNATFKILFEASEKRGSDPGRVKVWKATLCVVKDFSGNQVFLSPGRCTLMAW